MKELYGIDSIPQTAEKVAEQFNIFRDATNEADLTKLKGSVKPGGTVTVGNHYYQ